MTDKIDLRTESIKFQIDTEKHKLLDKLVDLKAAKKINKLKIFNKFQNMFKNNVVKDRKILVNILLINF